MAVFCPTSNLFIGSGLFDYQRSARRDKPLRIATATDVGGGTSYSMLRTMDEGYKVMQLRGQRLTPFGVVLPHDAGQCPGDVDRGPDRHAGGRARKPTSSC